MDGVAQACSASVLGAPRQQQRISWTGAEASQGHNKGAELLQLGPFVGPLNTGYVQTHSKVVGDRLKNIMQLSRHFRMYNILDVDDPFDVMYNFLANNAHSASAEAGFLEPRSYFGSWESSINMDTLIPEKHAEELYESESPEAAETTAGGHHAAEEVG